MSPGKITNDEGLKTEALSDPKISFGVHGGFLNSKNVDFCSPFSLNTTNLTGVGLLR